MLKVHFRAVIAVSVLGLSATVCLPPASAQDSQKSRH